MPIHFIIDLHGLIGLHVGVRVHTCVTRPCFTGFV